MGGGLGPMGARVFAALAIAATPMAFPACQSHSGGSTSDGNDASMSDASGMDDADVDPPPDSSVDGGVAAASLGAPSLTFPSLPCGGAPAPSLSTSRTPARGRSPYLRRPWGLGFRSRRRFFRWRQGPWACLR